VVAGAGFPVTSVLPDMLIDYWLFARAYPRFLGFGFVLAFLSSAGQTYFIHSSLEKWRVNQCGSSCL